MLDADGWAAATGGAQRAAGNKCRHRGASVTLLMSNSRELLLCSSLLSTTLFTLWWRAASSQSEQSWNFCVRLELDTEFILYQHKGIDHHKHSVWFHELRPHPRLDLTVTDRETGIEKTIWGRPQWGRAMAAWPWGVMSGQTCCLPARQSPDLPQLCCSIFLLLPDSASLPLCVTTESIFGCTASPF